jgi:DNA-binding LytR/AlgR family response regulator
MENRLAFCKKIRSGEKHVADSSFARCRQNYIVNMRHFQQISRNSYAMTTDEDENGRRQP